MCSGHTAATRHATAAPAFPPPPPLSLFPGRLDRKIELPLPDEKARGRIMQIHSRKMNVDKDGASGDGGEGRGAGPLQHESRLGR